MRIALVADEQQHSKMSDSEDSSGSLSDASIGPEDAWKDSLLARLDDIKSAGDFAVFNHQDTFANPGLQISGNDAIPLPLTASDAEAIKATCRQAPFGKGDQTVVDTSVRNTWELDPSQFRLANPAWESCFSKILHQATAGLGLLDVTAHLHKLLLYEEGSFFKRHKDSEKVAGTVGTLVVCLPSQHEGGDVVLSFNSEEKTFATAPYSCWDITSLAWFADVTHEVAKLTKGYRLVLTYNLVQAGHLKQSADSFRQQSQALRSTLLDWPTQAPQAYVVYYILDHQYTPSSLSLANLKGRDRAACGFLDDTCSDSGVFLILGHITRTETGADEYNKDDEGETSFSLNAMYSSYGTKIGAEFNVDEQEILNISKREPDSEDEAEYTGNEDAPPCFRYHDTVAMLVPKKYMARFLSEHAVYSWRDGLESNLVEMVGKDLDTHKDAGTEAAAVALFGKAIAAHTRDADTLRIVAHWAVELDEQDLYQATLKLASSCFQTRKPVIEIICGLIEERFEDEPDTIEWDKWYGDRENSRSLGTWLFIFEDVLSCLVSGHLQASWKGWAQTKMDQKLDGTPTIGVENLDFLAKSVELRHADSEWIKTRLLPALSSRGERLLLYRLTTKICEKDHLSSVGRMIFEYLVKHASSKIILREPDLHQHPDYYPGCSLGIVGPSEEFVAFLYQGIAIGAGARVLELLEAMHNDLAATLQSWDPSKISAGDLVHYFLKPLVHMTRNHPLSIKGLMELTIRHGLHAKLPKRPQNLSTADGINVESTEEVGAYKAAVERLISALWILRGDSMKGILGDQCYRELILLEGLVPEEPSTGVTGGKRASDEEISFSPEKRQKGC